MGGQDEEQNQPEWTQVAEEHLRNFRSWIESVDQNNKVDDIDQSAGGDIAREYKGEFKGLWQPLYTSNIVKKHAIAVIADKDRELFEVLLVQTEGIGSGVQRRTLIVKLNGTKWKVRLSESDQPEISEESFLSLYREYRQLIGMGIEAE